MQRNNRRAHGRPLLYLLDAENDSYLQAMMQLRTVRGTRGCQCSFQI